MGRQPSVAIGPVLNGAFPIPIAGCKPSQWRDDKRSTGSYKRTIVTRTAWFQDASRNEEEDSSSC